MILPYFQQPPSHIWGDFRFAAFSPEAESPALSTLSIGEMRPWRSCWHWCVLSLQTTSPNRLKKSSRRHCPHQPSQMRWEFSVQQKGSVGKECFHTWAVELMAWTALQGRVGTRFGDVEKFGGRWEADQGSIIIWRHSLGETFGQLHIAFGSLEREAETVVSLPHATAWVGSYPPALGTHSSISCSTQQNNTLLSGWWE